MQRSMDKMTKNIERGFLAVESVLEEEMNEVYKKFNEIEKRLKDGGL